MREEERLRNDSEEKVRREQAESKEKVRRDEEPPGLEEVERAQEAREEQMRAQEARAEESAGGARRKES